MHAIVRSFSKGLFTSQDDRLCAPSAESGKCIGHILYETWKKDDKKEPFSFL